MLPETWYGQDSGLEDIQFPEKGKKGEKNALEHFKFVLMQPLPTNTNADTNTNIIANTST